VLTLTQPSLLLLISLEPLCTNTCTHTCRQAGDGVCSRREGEGRGTRGTQHHEVHVGTNSLDYCRQDETLPIGGSDPLPTTHTHTPDMYHALANIPAAATTGLQRTAVLHTIEPSNKFVTYKTKHPPDQ
jgi:hypothetical protein